jgi:hypothetical protein
MTPSDRPSQAALTCLILLQTVMLTSLYAGVAPHPPLATPLFGIGPFIGASLSAAAAALILGPSQSPAGRVLAGTAAIAALVSFGPQKYFDPQFGLIWPAVLSGQVAVGVILLRLLSPPQVIARGKAHVG